MGKACLTFKNTIGTKLALTTPEVVCPTGEQITNGGFETGDFTGWTATGNIEVTTRNPHTGSYSARNPIEIGTVVQTLTTPVPTVCITATSTFRIYIWSDYEISPPRGGRFTAKINYTDATSTTVEREITKGEAEMWVEWDLKPYLEAGKTIESIEIKLDAGFINLMYIDDVSLVP